MALTLEQAVRFRLPTTPVKQGDKRRSRWQDAYGPPLHDAGLIDSPDQAAQVEIDALAALRPDDLTREAEAAIAPYWDSTLAKRCASATRKWRDKVQAELDATIDGAPFDHVRERAEEAAERFNEALESLREAQDELKDLDGELDELTFRLGRLVPDRPKPPEARIDEAKRDPLIDLDWPFADATRALKARKAYEDDAAADE